MPVIATSWIPYTPVITIMDNFMRQYTIILLNKKEPALTHYQVVSRVTFPEAVAFAYGTKHRMGYDWRIINVRENVTNNSEPARQTTGTITLS